MKSLNACAAAIAVAAAWPAWAGGIMLETHILKSETVHAAGGASTERLVPAAKAVPGDPMVYVLTYRNDGSQPAADVVFASPVPATMIYRGAGAGAEPEVSVDGARFAQLSELTVKGPGGLARAARLSDVTHVRWRFSTPIPAGASGEVSFHANLR